MPGKKKKKTSGGNQGLYTVINGRRLTLKEHPTDFSVMAASADVDAQNFTRCDPISPKLTRASGKSAVDRDRLMTNVREERIAHHIYQVQGTDEEIVIDDRLILTLEREGTGELEAIKKDHHLVYERRMGAAHVLRLTSETGQNPIKVANEISAREGVKSCSPHVMLDIQRHQGPALFPEQWYLTADLINNPDLLADADIQAPEAWEITKGSSEVVVAVIDDGFDLGHPAFTGVAIHPDRRDFVNGGSPEPGANDYHGTPVASISVGARNAQSSMRGIAPDCTFLPIRIGFGSGPQIDMLDVFQYVSERADVVNCSFGFSPSSIDLMDANFRSEITKLTESGGRRGTGLVMVFSAANDDTPTFLEGQQNINGVRFTGRNSLGQTLIREIAAGDSVFSGYPMTEGVVTVGSMTSLKRKSGYSCWGQHLAVTAPSNNLHYIMAFVAPGTPGRAEFVADYRGLGQVAAANRPGHGSPFSPIARFDDPSTTDLRENIYTTSFGGTSGAAPVVTGIAALMISANPDLTGQQVRQILMGTADQNLDTSLDLVNDPNIQGLSGSFNDGHSLFFGAGKVNAFRAVHRARALHEGDDDGNGDDDSFLPISISIGTRPRLSIPDNQPEGVISEIEICRSGLLASISVEVDITHTYRGDLDVSVISPDGLAAQLHAPNGNESVPDLKQVFSESDTPSLAGLVQAGTDIRGGWRLHVSDNFNHDVGMVNSWFLELQTT